MYSWFRYVSVFCIARSAVCRFAEVANFKLRGMSGILQTSIGSPSSVFLRNFASNSRTTNKFSFPVQAVLRKWLDFRQDGSISRHEFDLKQVWHFQTRHKATYCPWHHLNNHDVNSVSIDVQTLMTVFGLFDVSSALASECMQSFGAWIFCSFAVKVSNLLNGTQNFLDMKYLGYSIHKDNNAGVPRRKQMTWMSGVIVNWFIVAPCVAKLFFQVRAEYRQRGLTRKKKARRQGRTRKGKTRI